MFSDRFIKEVFFLGIGKIDDYYEIYAAFMPFINELANLFTIVFFKPILGLNIYPHSVNNVYQNFTKSFIDMLAITGIAANSAQYGTSYDREIGFVKGALYALFTFFIPNVYMDGLLKSFKTRTSKLFVGLFFIYLLDVCVHAFSYFYIIGSENQIKMNKKKEERKKLI
tara:strand:+ start:39 stop:545 length:507 start_codon:yes stop_codon:yes gene_type:complete